MPFTLCRKMVECLLFNVFFLNFTFICGSNLLKIPQLTNFFRCRVRGCIQWLSHFYQVHISVLVIFLQNSLSVLCFQFMKQLLLMCYENRKYKILMQTNNIRKLNQIFKLWYDLSILMLVDSSTFKRAEPISGWHLKIKIKH